MYRNSVDALWNLLSVEHRNSEVNQISAKSGSMQNGIAYCSCRFRLPTGRSTA